MNEGFRKLYQKQKKKNNIWEKDFNFEADNIAVRLNIDNYMKRIFKKPVFIKEHKGNFRLNTECRFLNFRKN